MAARGGRRSEADLVIAGFVGSEVELARGIALLINNTVVVEYLLRTKPMLACDERKKVRKS